MSAVTNILKTLIDARTSLNAYQIEEVINYNPDKLYYTIQILRTRLAQMILEGLVVNDGTHCCNACRLSASVYRITDKGRILFNLKHPTGGDFDGMDAD